MRVARAAAARAAGGRARSPSRAPCLLSSPHAVTGADVCVCARARSFTHFEKDAVIFRQGDAPHAFYVVLHGEVRMTTARVNKGYDSNRGTDKDDVAAADKQNDDGSTARCSARRRRSQSRCWESR